MGNSRSYYPKEYQIMGDSPPRCFSWIIAISGINFAKFINFIGKIYIVTYHHQADTDRDSLDYGFVTHLKFTENDVDTMNAGNIKRKGSGLCETVKDLFRSLIYHYFANEDLVVHLSISKNCG